MSAVITLGAELETSQRALAEHVDRMAPGVLAIHGVGPVTAAIILAVCSHHGWSVPKRLSPPPPARIPSRHPQATRAGIGSTATGTGN